MIVTLNIPDAQAPRFVDAYCFAYSYSAQVLNAGAYVANPESRAAFARRMMLSREKDFVLAQEQAMASFTAGAVLPPDIT